MRGASVSAPTRSFRLLEDGKVTPDEIARPLDVTDLTFRSRLGNEQAADHRLLAWHDPGGMLAMPSRRTSLRQFRSGSPTETA